MTDIAQIAEIARGLTPYQCAVLINMVPGQYRDWPGSARDPRSFQRAGRDLMDRRLIKWNPNPRQSSTLITTLGISVRAYLLSQSDGGERG